MGHGTLFEIINQGYHNFFAEHSRTQGFTAGERSPLRRHGSNDACGARADQCSILHACLYIGSLLHFKPRSAVASIGGSVDPPKKVKMIGRPNRYYI